MAEGQQGGGCFALIGKVVVFIILAIVALIFVIPLINGGTASQQSINGASSSEFSDNNWTPPPGFIKTRSDGFNSVNIGVRWLEAKDYECRFGRACWGMEFVSEEPCSHFYAAITLLDSANTNIGFTNDSTTGVAAGQKVRLVFETYEEGARSAELSRVSCQ